MTSEADSQNRFTNDTYTCRTTSFEAAGYKKRADTFSYLPGSYYISAPCLQPRNGCPVLPMSVFPITTLLAFQIPPPDFSNRTLDVRQSYVVFVFFDSPLSHRVENWPILSTKDYIHACSFSIFRMHNHFLRRINYVHHNTKNCVL